MTTMVDVVVLRAAIDDEGYAVRQHNVLIEKWHPEIHGDKLNARRWGGRLTGNGRRIL